MDKLSYLATDEGKQGLNRHASETTTLGLSDSHCSVQLSPAISTNLGKHIKCKPDLEKMNWT